MRALARSAAVLLAIAGCGPNPYFKLIGESNEGGASGTDTADTNTGAETSGSTAPDLPPCEPVPVVEAQDDCDPSKIPLPPPEPPPNMVDQSMFKDVACGTKSDLYVRRVTDTEIQLCPAGCAGECDAAKTLSVAGFGIYPTISSLLPQLGECARLWHVSKPDVDNVCQSLAYAFWDTTGEQSLRLAVTLGDLDAFAGLAELPIAVTTVPQQQFVCTALDGLCDRTVEVLNVDLDGCEFPAPQNAEWKNIPFQGREYIFSARSYTCLNAPSSFGWYLRRDQ